MNGRLIRTRFLESEIVDGDYHSAPSTETTIEELEDYHAIDFFKVCEREGLGFESATGNEWAANPDGSRIIDYATGEREEVSFHFGDDVPERIKDAVMRAVDTGKV